MPLFVSQALTFITGNAVDAVEVEHHKNCKLQIAKGRIAVDGIGKEETSYISFSAVGDELVAQLKNTKKGDWLSIVARLKQDRWENGGTQFSRLNVVVMQVRVIPKKARATDKAAATDQAFLE